jgi:hypothetical protein
MEVNKGSQEGFLRWLEMFEDDGIIGYAGDSGDCPLQHYLKSINPTLVVFVGARIILWEGSLNKREALENWQIVVVKAVDRKGNGAITKKEFIEAY